MPNKQKPTFSEKKKLNYLFMKMGIIKHHKDQIEMNMIESHEKRGVIMSIKEKGMSETELLKIYKNKLSDLNYLFHSLISYLKKHLEKIDEHVVISQKNLDLMLELGHQEYLRLKKQQQEDLGFESADNMFGGEEIQNGTSSFKI